MGISLSCTFRQTFPSVVVVREIAMSHLHTSGHREEEDMTYFDMIETSENIKFCTDRSL